MTDSPRSEAADRLVERARNLTPLLAEHAAEVFDLDARLETLGQLRLGLEAPGALI